MTIVVFPAAENHETLLKQLIIFIEISWKVRVFSVSNDKQTGDD